MGFLSRKRVENIEPPTATLGNIMDDIAPKLNDLDGRIERLASQLEDVEKTLKQMPNASDFRLLASEIARLETEIERMEGKHKEGMLAMYAQVHKELRAVRGDRVIEMIDIEPVTDEKLEEASDQLSQLAKIWRKRRANPSQGE